jgi:molybdenum cofactor cytidylyltransferase
MRRCDLPRTLRTGSSPDYKRFPVPSSVRIRSFKHPMTWAIILGAGLSRRMGGQKLVLPFAGSTVIARVVDAFLGAPVPHTLVVIRPDDRQLRAALVSRPVSFVENPDPQGDMLSSVRCGLRAIPAEAEVVLVSPGDQPALESGLIREMLTAFQSADRGILVPVCDGRRGHPLVFAARYCRDILSSYDGVGLRGFVRDHADQVLEWPTLVAAVVEDLDTPADYQAALRKDQPTAAPRPK